MGFTKGFYTRDKDSIFRSTLFPFWLSASIMSVDDGKLDFVLDRIQAIHQHARLLPKPVPFPRALTRDLTRILMIDVAIVGQRVERH